MNLGTGGLLEHQKLQEFSTIFASLILEAVNAGLRWVLSALRA